MSYQAAVSGPSPNQDQDTSFRSRALDKFFYRILEGKGKVTGVRDAQKFLESIVNRTDRPDCIERLASSKSGQEALHKSLTIDTSPQFINSHVSNLLKFLADPALQRVCEGELLNQVLWVMVDPSLFWDSLIQNVKSDQLETQVVEGFAWLLLQLILLPQPRSSKFRETALSLCQDDTLKKLEESSSPISGSIFQKIRALVQPSQSVANSHLVNKFSPGGRHDNDFANYHDISILPTRAEMESTERPFYMQAGVAFEEGNINRALDHLDNQFRLLREDMLADMREDLKNMRNKARRQNWRNMVIKDLSLEDIHKESMTNDRPCNLVLRCSEDILNMKKASIEDRKKELKKTPAFLKHQSFGCFMKDDALLAFASLDRNEDKLSLNPPRICLQVVGEDSMLADLLLALQRGTVDFLLVSTPIFAYEPILERLKRKTDVELDHDILVRSKEPQESPIKPEAIIDALEASLATPTDLQRLINAEKNINLDPSQVRALIYGLQYQTCQIQGPPGTGKSLVGALLTKILLDETKETLLVLSFTNHALDQFIEDLLDIGIDRNAIVRLGSKFTDRTESLTLKNSQTAGYVRLSRTRHDLINAEKAKLQSLAEGVEKHFDSFSEARISHNDLLEFLEFSDTESHFFDALEIPEAADGETRVGKKGASMKPDYLFDLWANGKQPGPFAKDKSEASSKEVWAMKKQDRQAKIEEWKHEIHRERISTLAKWITDFNKTYKTLQSLRKEKTEQTLQSKRIICCTTTAASMYAQEIQSAAPGIIIVEEAGEILESHILAAMGPSTKQLIQIGDHKQLRPKVKNFKLTVEAGHGFDLNRSLFERLIVQGQPHCTLLNQHRMRPEISALIRHNYPDLEDANDTQGRPQLLGFQDNVVFINHNNLEAKHNILVDKLDPTAGSSKQNIFEADMVLKCVRYLGQQNYKTSNIVILTPYLGQLSLLRNKLSKDHDPTLNDLDSHDLVEAGEIPAASAEVNKTAIRLSTIDNYQGEESDIVVASLTRSNDDGDIGFMCAPERLNVLISRARNALIMIGNASTFMNAKKGRDEWIRLFDHLKKDGRIQDGFPLRCEKHPETKHIVRSPDEFEFYCPDGGCTLPCNELLSCGKHTCSKRCHIRVDHSKMPCDAIINDHCPQKHKLTWACFNKTPPACQVCRREQEEKARRARRDKELELERQAKQLAYAKLLKVLQEDIEKQRKIIKDAQEERIKEQTLQQHRLELAELTKQARKPVINNSNPVPDTKGKRQPTKDSGKPSKDDNQTPRPENPPTKNMPGQWPAENTSTPSTKHNDDDNNNNGNKNNTNNGNGNGHDGSTNSASNDGKNDGKNDSHNSEHVDHDENDSPGGSTPGTPQGQPFPSRGPSAAETDWQYQKKYENAFNEALDSLFQMIGLESVKKEFLAIKARIDTAVRQGVDTKNERFGAALLGNPGTGKTTVARLYAKFLSSVGAIPGDHFEETTGSRLANDGIQGCQALIDKILEKGGGVFFLDEAYQIVSGSSFGGAQVLDFLLAEIENLTGKVVFVFAGYRKQMEGFFAHNPGIPSRIPIEMSFQDYEDDELLKIMNYQLTKKYNGRMQVEGGSEGLYMRVAARRIGRGRGREGFGNARQVENVLTIILRRQADRLHHERRQGNRPNDLLLQKIDLIGPEPSKQFSSNKDWQKLQSMIGLGSVKQSVMVLVDRLQTNYERELKEQPPVECSLNKVFFGNPGTGKTTVAKLYGKILKALGLLSNGEVVIKNPSDFVGAALGQSEKNTKAILESTKGKVLIIDEAYMLAGGSSDSGGFSDPYKTAVVDTIVAEVQSTALEDRCVLLLGYKEMMEDMFQKVNPGLTRRFPMSSGFNFQDYDDGELRQILDLKLKQQGFRAGEPAKRVVGEVLRRARNRPNFGNAGEVDIILDRAKDSQQKRLSMSPQKKNTDVLIPADIDPEFDRSERAGTNIRMLFKDVIGCEEIVEQLEGYQQVVQNMKAMDMDPCSQIPFGFLFRGPPGTGKTTTARRMGKVYYDMGFLADATVVDCSATDLIGQYVGHTGPKVQKKFDEALGRVLFIDEAYRLAEGHFAKEAMDEIVDCLTKERYHNKLVVILAGYDNDINRLMNQNPGLTSRFPETISFPNLPPRHCRDLLLQCLQKKKLDTKDLEASPTLDGKLLSLFGTLAQTPSWGNARDVQTLVKSIFSKIMKSKTPNPSRTVPEDIVIDVIKTMLDERTKRAKTANPNPFPFSSLPLQQAFQDPPPPPKISTATAIDTAPAAEKKDEEPPKKDSDGPGGPPKGKASIRDAGVSDAVWEQLQRDRAAFEQRQLDLAKAKREAEELERQLRLQEEALRREKDEAKRREELRKLEEARVRHELAERARREQEERVKKEKAMQEKLMRMGRCPVGYEWIPQGDGYRCAGGSHFMSNGQLGI
ncbi:P-loop containing nucleoside triphosphate hydrolase protein [Daldinia vernicosa]|uniref:P-loop containing nucleoside triphosphate hydrolase protein n=1 Tax=Daldinia vernicosa TaxID=114800 RepID=UPI0020083021|nr:P-loop containing nucleoside triphosphate hydrolase protein [Daldinia vernicosa]KAI0846858.1 P-loop containing nucleoside triphosphate hydrolase protein [Daldinia vernicosa]